MSIIGTRFLVFAALAASAIGAIVQTLPPPPLPQTAPLTEFSAERAMRHIRVIAAQPHPTGSLANAAVRDYILSELEQLRLETETQRDGNLENIAARIVGTESSDAVLLTAHYDSTLQSPGASDDASGVAVLLETVRALKTTAPYRNTVMFLFTDNEEGGWFGARAFIARHPWAKDAKVVVGFDAGGVSGPGVLSTTSPQNGWLIRQLIAVNPHMVGSSAVNALADSRTDFGYAFKPAGFSGYAFDYYWDKRDGHADNLENLNLASVQHQGYHALALARHFGSLEQLTDPKEVDLVYYSVLRLCVISYSSSWALAIATPVLGIYVAVLATGLRRRIISWKGLGVGTFAIIAGSALAALPSLFLDHVLGRWIPGVTSAWDNRVLDQPAEMSSIALFSLSMTILWYAWAQRVTNARLPNLTVGALVPPAAGMLVSSIMIPALSFAFTWACLASTLAIANFLFGFPQHKNRSMVVMGLVASAVTSIIIVGPTLVLGLFDQLSLALVALGALSGTIAPQIHLALRELEPQTFGSVIAACEGRS